MKHLPNIASGLLGFAFLLFGLNFFFHFIPMPTPPADSLAIPFFQATGQSGFMGFVKIVEIIGALLVFLPKTRNWGLLLITPVVANILAFNLFVVGGVAVFQPPVIAVTLLSAYLLWEGREKFLGLLS